MRMQRRLEPVDLAVIVGLFATVVGGYFLFLASNGTLEAGYVSSTMVDASPGGANPMDAMQWVQPALGQAIVDDSLLEQQIARGTTRVARELNHSTMIGHYLGTAPARYFAQLKTSADAVERDHQARVQHVMGSSIIGFTGRGVRNGLISPTRLNSEYNRRMIERTEANGNRMDDAYNTTREPLLGWTIVAASQGYLQFTEQAQERIGTAVARLTQVQQGFEEAIGETQAQLATVALASVHTEQIADRFDQLAQADLSRTQPVAFSAPRSWPAIPFRWFIGISACLVGLFCIGLMTPRREEEAIAEAEPEAAPYRKTA
jgi:hypothetical protein